MITNQEKVNNSKQTNINEKELDDMSTKEQKVETNNTAYYEECAKHLSAPESVDYLASRGVSLSTARQFNCGFDPATKCIIVPVNDHSYVARSIDDTSSVRFRNPAGQETGITNSDVLFSDDPAPIFVVKGAFDMLGIVETGANAIALNGVQHNKILIDLINNNKKKKVNKTLLIDLGNDIEGRENTDKLVEALTGIGVTCKAVNLSCGYRDPNEALRHNKAAFVENVTTNVDLITKPDNTYSYYLSEALARDVAEMKSHEHRSTGFPELDKKIGVLTNGLYILGGVPSVGKTTFMLQIADQMARLGEHVLYFTLEQSKLELIAKSVARESAISCAVLKKDPGIAVSSLDILFDRKPREARPAFEVYYKMVGKRVSIVECFAGLTVKTIEDKVKDYERYNHVKPIVFVDYLQTLSAELDPETKRKATDVKQIVDDNISRLQGLAKSMGLLIFAISSLNRTNYTQTLDFESFKETGKIEYGADRLFGLQLSIVHDPEFINASTERKRELIQQAKAEIPRKIDFGCLKNRSGFPVFTLRFHYYPDRDLYVERDTDKGGD